MIRNLWPYDEVRLEFDHDAGWGRILAPWANIRVKVSDGNRSRFSNLVSKLNSNQLDPSDINEINWFFSNFSQFPLCYILPQINSTKSDRHSVNGDKKFGEGVLTAISELVQKCEIRERFGIEADFANNLARKLDQALIRKNWEWDLDALMDFSKTSGGFCPLSAYSVARRYHLLEVLESATNSETYTDFRNQSAEEFRETAALLVRQNHFVTQMCDVSVSGAIQSAQSAAIEIQEFREEERGHDRILGVALESILETSKTGKSFESVKVADLTRLIMLLLHEAGRFNLLGFAMVVDIFERNTYEEVDPLAKLLREKGFEKAAQCINRHKDINDSGGHENLAETFLESMAPVDEEYLKEAIRFAELVSIVENSIPIEVAQIMNSSAAQ
ncbi:MAG: hypothetical protein KDD25_00675 [Bdellovibrionales bacterium]|nr:hypothetical protein [Bdellovibrionales bacterium]